MNQKEYELIASVFRQRKREALQIGYSVHSQTTFDLAIIITLELQHRLADQLEKTYKSFDRDKFTESCRVDGVASFREIWAEKDAKKDKEETEREKRIPGYKRKGGQSLKDLMN